MLFKMLVCTCVALFTYLKVPKCLCAERKGCVGTGAFSSISLEGRMGAGTAKVQSKD